MKKTRKIEKSDIKSDLSCQFCGQEFGSVQGKISHQTFCSQNPKIIEKKLRKIETEIKPKIGMKIEPQKPTLTEVISGRVSERIIDEQVKKMETSLTDKTELELSPSPQQAELFAGQLKQLEGKNKSDLQLEIVKLKSEISDLKKPNSVVVNSSDKLIDADEIIRIMREGARLKQQQKIMDVAMGNKEKKEDDFSLKNIYMMEKISDLKDRKKPDPLFMSMLTQMNNLQNKIIDRSGKGESFIDEYKGFLELKKQMESDYPGETKDNPVWASVMGKLIEQFGPVAMQYMKDANTGARIRTAKSPFPQNLNTSGEMPKVGVSFGNPGNSENPEKLGVQITTNPSMPSIKNPGVAKPQVVVPVDLYEDLVNVGTSDKSEKKPEKSKTLDEELEEQFGDNLTDISSG